MLARQIGAALLAFLVACSSVTRYTPEPPPPGFPPDTLWYEAVTVEPGAVSTRPVPMSQADFTSALLDRVRGMPVTAAPPEWALWQLQAGWQADWVAEVYRGKVYTLVPLRENAVLESELESQLRGDYHGWCGRVHSRQGEDCLSLFEMGGPWLRTDDRRVLALDVAFANVLRESEEALVRELTDPRLVLGTLVWLVGTYLFLLAVPEPAISKGLVAAITTLLVAWLGVRGLYNLVDAYVEMANAAHHARTFDELHAAGEQFARVIGETSARALILAVAALAGRTMGEWAGRVASMPGYAPAAAQWSAQAGGAAAMPLATAVGSVELAAMNLQGALSFVMVMKGRTVAVEGVGTATIAVRHRGGNMQVQLPNGQRWHVSRGKSVEDIPRHDPLGDQLQEAVIRVAQRWNPGRDLTPNERRAIDKALRKGEHHEARLLEAQARGRWVERQVEMEFPNLKFSTRGVDLDVPGGYKYEILSGTDYNMSLHGRRMHDILFRMITF